jgi:polyribonucleotide nucleotidyltransferase
MVAASAALTLSGAPFMGPIAAARVGYQSTASTSSTRPGPDAEGRMDLVVAGTATR